MTVACFSCNADHGFPDADVVEHVERRRPDLAVFLGDQFYESQGGFGVQTAPLDKACLDYLRKWYMFGWSYRDLFRHRPAAFIPDDHDVYHGNIWGEGGIHAPTDHGWGYAAQDRGGYKMPAEWVNAVQRSQTSHLPDAYDPTPAAQGIGVYYAAWNYAGVSFAILEDRKFKSAPGHVLPASAKVVNGFPTDPGFDPTAVPGPPGGASAGNAAAGLSRRVGGRLGGCAGSRWSSRRPRSAPCTRCPPAARTTRWCRACRSRHLASTWRATRRRGTWTPTGGRRTVETWRLRAFRRGLRVPHRRRPAPGERHPVRDRSPSPMPATCSPCPR